MFNILVKILYKQLEKIYFCKYILQDYGERSSY